MRPRFTPGPRYTEPHHPWSRPFHMLTSPGPRPSSGRSENIKHSTSLNTISDDIADESCAQFALLDLNRADGGSIDAPLTQMIFVRRHGSHSAQIPMAIAAPMPPGDERPEVPLTAWRCVHCRCCSTRRS
jgi:hypothetical protein